MNTTLLAAVIFIFTYVLIVTERVPRTVSALLGGMAVIIFGILSQEHAFTIIDWNVIFLLVGMMIIANVLRETGIFQWIAVQSVRVGKGDPFRIMLILVLVTAVSSALLDNVTIVVLVVPVTIFVAASLRMSPIPFLIVEILAANIGGAATLVGDPPNILIGSAANIDFITFAANMAPISIINLIALAGMSWLLFKNDLKTESDYQLNIEALDASELITDITLMRKSIIVMGFVIIGFFIHGALQLEPATIAMTGAIILVLWGRVDPNHVLRDIEWATLFFFIGLFILVEALVEVGIIESVAHFILSLTEGNLVLTSMLLLWFSAVASGIVDNIPYTATMIPVVENLGTVIPAEPLWWSLALGACLGGNATMVGAAANVVVANLAEKSGHPLSFSQFLRYSLVVTFVSILFASLYVWFRYL